ncbi:MAG: hypothetical protein Q4G03_06295 [Planctomycetia bacterium]|nr:hypothetical protein [Planctomycetia bacterium]
MAFWKRSGRSDSHKRLAKENATSTRRIARFEKLERRELLALSTTSADYRALIADTTFDSSEDDAIWVTTLNDVSNANDGKISLREAIDYAGQSMDAGLAPTTIRFKVSGVISLSNASQSLKILSKSITIDASDVSGVTIQANRSAAFYVFNNASSSPTTTNLVALTIKGATTWTSSANAVKGGAIQLSANCNLKVNNCQITGVTVPDALGAGIYVASGSLSLIDTTISDVTAQSSQSLGGAVYLESGSVTAVRSSFDDNASGEGGAIYVKSGDVALADCSLNGNVASYANGGAVFSNGVLTVSNSTFRDNLATGNGGAIHAEGDFELQITDGAFYRNQAVNGGAIYQETQSITVNASSFNDNVATGSGGAVYNTLNSYIKAIDSSFLGNEATVNGGAIYNVGYLYTTGDAYESNKALNGGAIYTTGYLEARDLNASLNIASYYGGTIYSNARQRSWLLHSYVQTGQAYEGGALYNAGEFTVADSALKQNQATTSGGAVVNLGELYIAQTQITENYALGENGAGAAALNYANATITVVNSQIDGNCVENGSGGALANNGTALFDNVAMANNSVGAFGGAVYNIGAFTAQYCNFFQNNATDGGAYADTFGSSTLIVSSTLWGNAASNNGGAFYSYGASSLRGTTIAYNTASTLDYAAYYSPMEAYAQPSFDSTTVLSDNTAASSSAVVETNDTLVLTDENYIPIDDCLFFGAHAVGSDALVKTVRLTNIGTTSVTLSDFNVGGVTDANGLEYSLYDATGSLISDADAIVVQAGDSIALRIQIAPKKLGAKLAIFNWSTSQQRADGVTVIGERSISCLMETAKAIGASISLSSVSDRSGVNFTVNQNGSFSIALTKAPSANLIVYLKSTDNVDLSDDVLLFTPSNYNVSQTVTVSVNREALRNGMLGSTATITPQFIISDALGSGSAFNDITLTLGEYFVFDNDSCVNLNDKAPEGTVRWDLTGNGYADVITYGSDYWLNASRVTGDTITSMRTKNGVTTSTVYDVVKLDPLPSADAELTVFDAVPGFARIALTSDTGAMTSWRINWGDESPYSTYDKLSTDAVFAHCYQKDGVYNVSVELIDADGQSSGWSPVCTLTVSGVDASSSALIEYLAESEESETPLTLAELDDTFELQETSELDDALQLMLADFMQVRKK